MSFEAEIDRFMFISLWSKIQSIHLSNSPDKASWNLTTDGQYSATSAYDIQFTGRILRDEMSMI
jgi:hypothetical protein